MPESRVFEQLRGQPRLTYYHRSYYTQTGWRVVQYPLASMNPSVQPTLEEAQQFTRNFGLKSSSGGDYDEEEEEDEDSLMGGGVGEFLFLIFGRSFYLADDTNH